MIITKKELKEYIREESLYYKSVRYDIRNKIVSHITCDNELYLKKYLRVLRYCEYHLNNSYYKTKKIKKIHHDAFYIFYLARKNRLGRMLGLEINENSFKKGLTIYHAGYIVVNQNAQIGKNCKLHGCNCIGNDGKNNKAPVIGDNVTIGVGASVIGDITIADNVKIGAGAVVVKSINVDGATIIGIPAREKYTNNNI